MTDTLGTQLVALLRAKQLHCAVAESCTGGLVSAAITDVAGASAVFVGGAVTYTNEMKQKLLMVSAETLAKYSAVSPQTATEMAEGLRMLTSVDIAVAITGNAGPEPSEGKPVGMVFVATASVLGSRAYAIDLAGVPPTRAGIRHAAVQSALAAIIDTAKQLG